MTRARVQRFGARIYRVGSNACVDVPLRVSRYLKPYARAGHVRVEGILNGVDIRGTVVPVARGLDRMFVSQAIRRRANVVVGDLVQLAIRPASAQVTTPPRVAAALREMPGALAAFKSLDPKHRRELLRFIDDAKSAAAWRNSIRKTAEHLLGKPASDACPPGAPSERAASAIARPLWTCPKCSHRFVNRNTYHSCKRHRLEDVFRGKPGEIRRLFDRFREMVEANGPVTLLAYPNRVGFMVRIRFAGATPARKWLDVGFWLPRRIKHPRIHKIETILPNAHLHGVRVTRLDDFDDQLAAWIKEAYACGCQEHLRR